MNRKLAVSLIVVMLLASGFVLLVPRSSVASYTSSDAIRVNGEGELLYQVLDNGWSGDGSSSSPYIITSLVINIPEGGAGIFLGNISSYVTITNCYIYATADTLTEYGAGAGITLFNSSNVTVQNCYLLRNHIGLMMVGCDHVNVYNNIIVTYSSYYSGDVCVSSVSSSYVNVTGNSLSSEATNCVELSESDHNDIANNTITDCAGAGIYIFDASANNDIMNNTIRNCQYGVRLTGGSDSNTIQANSIVNSSSYGIYAISTSGNEFCANMLLKNNGANETYDAAHMQAFDTGSNAWSVGGYGNCWLDLQTDSNGDGMVDSAYVIAGGSAVDDHPVRMNITVSWPSTVTTYTNLSEVNITGAAIDGIGISKVVWLNSNNVKSGLCSGTNSWVADVTLQEGYNNITIYVTDHLGARFSYALLIISNDAGPSIVCSGGSSIYTNVSSPTNLTLKVKSAYGLDHVTQTWYSGTSLVSTDTIQLGSDRYYNLTIAHELKLGQNALNVTAVDMMGNVCYLNISLVYDVTAPTLISVYPTGTDVATNTYFILKFSEAMNTSSVKLDLGSLSGTYYWSGNVVTIVTNGTFAAGTTYAQAISGKDLAGNALAAQNITFTTASTATVYGRAFDSDGNPLEGASVTLGSMSTVTDSDGNYEFDGVSGGSYTITIYKAGYGTVSETITVAAGSSVQVTNRYLDMTGGSITMEMLIVLGVIMVALIGAAVYLLKKP